MFIQILFAEKVGFNFYRGKVGRAVFRVASLGVFAVVIGNNEASILYARLMNLAAKDLDLLANMHSRAKTLEDEAKARGYEEGVARAADESDWYKSWYEQAEEQRRKENIENQNLRSAVKILRMLDASDLISRMATELQNFTDPMIHNYVCQPTHLGDKCACLRCVKERSKKLLALYKTGEAKSCN